MADEFTITRCNILFLKGVYLKDLSDDNCQIDVALSTKKYNEYVDKHQVKKIYVSNPCIFTNLLEWTKTTNCLCWHCSCSFENIPVFIPEEIRINNKGETEMPVIGNFCSFPCAQRYINEKYKNDGSHDDKTRCLKILYKIFTGKKIMKIIPAPDKTEMMQYSGVNGLTLEQFREKISSLSSDYNLTSFKMDHFKFNC